MKQYVAALLCAALAFSCAASLPYASDYPLTEQTFRSRDGSFSGKVPRGWFASSGDTVVPAVVAWLVRDDLSAAMGVRELNLDRLSGERVGKDGVQLLARISAGLHEGGAGTSTVVSGAREFELRGKKFCGYEIASGGKRSRVVVFSAGGRYYECEATGSKGDGSGEAAARMFSAQQTLLGSLTY